MPNNGGSPVEGRLLRCPESPIEMMAVSLNAQLVFKGLTNKMFFYEATTKKPEENICSRPGAKPCQFHSHWALEP
jgi:hypothetical protein